MDISWWSWAVLGYIAVGVIMLEDAYRADSDHYDQLEHWLWVICALGAVVVWPWIWWLGLDKKS